MAELYQRWWHSFEEDHDDVAVYRPEGFELPRARGRRGLELGPDGTFLELGIGRGDETEPRAGLWRSDAGRERLDVTTSSGDRRTMQVVRLDDDRLELRTDGA
jgi:hypothetical protein